MATLSLFSMTFGRTLSADGTLGSFSLSTPVLGSAYTAWLQVFQCIWGALMAVCT